MIIQLDDHTFIRLYLSPQDDYTSIGMDINMSGKNDSTLLWRYIISIQAYENLKIVMMIHLFVNDFTVNKRVCFSKCHFRFFLQESFLGFRTNFIFSLSHKWHLTIFSPIVENKETLHLAHSKKRKVDSQHILGFECPVLSPLKEQVHWLHVRILSRSWCPWRPAQKVGERKTAAYKDSPANAILCIISRAAVPPNFQVTSEASFHSLMHDKLSRNTSRRLRTTKFGMQKVMFTGTAPLEKVQRRRWGLLHMTTAARSWTFFGYVRLREVRERGRGLFQSQQCATFLVWWLPFSSLFKVNAHCGTWAVRVEKITGIRTSTRLERAGLQNHGTKEKEKKNNY